MRNAFADDLGVDRLVEVRLRVGLWWANGQVPCHFLRDFLELARSRDMASLADYIGQHEVVLDAWRAWVHSARVEKVWVEDLA